MAVNKSIMEQVELSEGGDVSVYMNKSPRVALTFTQGSTEYCIWVTEDEARQISSAVNKVLEEYNNG